MRVISQRSYQFRLIQARSIVAAKNILNPKQIGRFDPTQGMMQVGKDLAKEFVYCHNF